MSFNTTNWNLTNPGFIRMQKVESLIALLDELSVRDFNLEFGDEEHLFGPKNFVVGLNTSLRLTVWENRKLFKLIELSSDKTEGDFTYHRSAGEAAQAAIRKSEEVLARCGKQTAQKLSWHKVHKLQYE